MVKLLVNYNTVFSSKRSRNFAIKNLTIVPNKETHYYDTNEYYNLPVETASVVFCLIKNDNLDYSVQVYNIYETYEKAVNGLSKANDCQMYISEFRLEKTTYVKSDCYYKIKHLTLLFNESVHNYHFLCKYINDVFDNANELKGIVPNLDETSEELELRLSAYNEDLERAKCYREKIISKLNVEEDLNFESAVKGRYPDNSEEIITFLSQFKSVNAVKSDRLIMDEIKKKMPSVC